MLTKFDVLKRLAGIGLPTPLVEVEAALGQVNQTAIFNAEKQRFSVEVWDKFSPINGVSAEKVLEQPGFSPDGEIYKIYVDGHLRILQPYSPTDSGYVRMTPENVLEIAGTQVDVMAWRDADEQIFEQVIGILF